MTRLSSVAKRVHDDERGWRFSDGAPVERDAATCLEDPATVVQQAVPEGPLALPGVSCAAPIALAYAAQNPHRMCRFDTQGDRIVALESGCELAAALPQARFEVLATETHIRTPGSAAFERTMDAVQDFRAEGEAGSMTVLTASESQLVEYLAQGLDNACLTRHLALSEETMRTCMNLLYRKHGVDGRSQALVRARASGFGTASR